MASHRNFDDGGGDEFEPFGPIAAVIFTALVFLIGWALGAWL